MPRVEQNPIREFLPSNYWGRWFDWFVYSVEYNPLAAGAVRIAQNFLIDNDSDFLVQSVAVVAVQPAAPQTEATFPPVLLNVQDTGSGAVWFAAQQHIVNIAGRNAVDGPGPTALDVPRWISATSTVTVEATNLDAATAFRVFISFRGCKIYRGMQRGLQGN